MPVFIGDRRLFTPLIYIKCKWHARHLCLIYVVTILFLMAYELISGRSKMKNMNPGDSLSETAGIRNL